MDLTDSEDEAVAEYQNRGSLVKSEREIQEAEKHRLSKYDSKAKNQSDKRKHLLLHVFNRRREDFNSDKEFDAYEEYRELTIWQEIKGFDKWQFCNQGEWAEFEIDEMKLLSQRKMAKRAVKLDSGKVVNLKDMEWCDEDGNRGEVKRIRTVDTIQKEKDNYKAVIENNKLLLMNEANELEAKLEEERRRAIEKHEKWNKEDQELTDEKFRELHFAGEDIDPSKQRNRFSKITKVFEQREKSELEGSLFMYGGTGADEVPRKKKAKKKSKD